MLLFHNNCIFCFNISEHFVPTVKIEFGDWDDKDSSVSSASYLFIRNVINLEKRLVLVIL